MELHQKLKVYELSWYINPHLFWLRAPIRPDDVSQMELQMNKWYHEQSEIQHNRFRPKVGESVAYYNPVNRVWYRGIIDYKFNLYKSKKEEYIIWLIDRGYPINATNLFIRKLELPFCDLNLSENIVKVGLSHVLPAIQRYDYMNECPYKEQADNWDALTVRKFKEYLEKAECIKFNPEYYHQGQYFGEIWIQNYEEGFMNAHDYLVTELNALKTDKSMEFLDEIQEGSTLDIERYQDNDRHKIKPDQLHTRVNPLDVDGHYHNFSLQNAIKCDDPTEMHYSSKVGVWLDKYFGVPHEKSDEASDDSEEILPVLTTMGSFSIEPKQKPMLLQKFVSLNVQKSVQNDLGRFNSLKSVKSSFEQQLQTQKPFELQAQKSFKNYLQDIPKHPVTKDVMTFKTLLGKIRENGKAEKGLVELKRVFPAGYENIINQVDRKKSNVVKSRTKKSQKSMGALN